MFTRREFVAGVGALLPAASLASYEPSPKPEPILPSALKKGDTVAVLAPAGFIDDPDVLQKAIAKVASLGYVPVLGKHADDRHGYLAGKDEDRADDLNSAFRNADVRAIIALRGGYGCARILSLLDYDRFQSDPKVVVGYSDVTALLVALQRKTGVVTFHGPVADSTFSAFSVDWFGRAVETPTPIGKLPNIEGALTLFPGTSRGRLVGGNLSVLESLRGTPYGPDLDGAIVFVEDVNEDPYRVDRMLTSFLLTGVNGLKGLVFGLVTPPKPKPDDKPDLGWSIAEVLKERALAFGVPCFRGLATGHLADKATVPLGVMAELDADRCTLTVAESAVKPAS